LVFPFLRESRPWAGPHHCGRIYSAMSYHKEQDQTDEFEPK
jgi:hypothetical protein